jgi:hypothetical protein
MRASDFDKVHSGGEELLLDHLYIVDGRDQRAYLFCK